MKTKHLIITAASLAVILPTQLLAVCAYQDCGQYVLTHRMIFQQKLATTIVTTNELSDNVHKKYSEQLQALEEQNKVLKNLETLSAKNNMLLREIALESEKAAALTTTSGKISAKTNESLQRTGETTSASLKFKTEDIQ